MVRSLGFTQIVRSQCVRDEGGVPAPKLSKTLIEQSRCGCHGSCELDTCENANVRTECLQNQV